MYQPLADELRPTTLDDVYGQEEILGEGRMLRRMIESGRVPNLIFYGPSGTLVVAQHPRGLGKILILRHIIEDLVVFPVHIHGHLPPFISNLHCSHVEDTFYTFCLCSYNSTAIRNCKREIQKYRKVVWEKKGTEVLC